MCVVCVYCIHTTQFTAGFQPGDTIKIIRTDGSVVVDSNWLVVSIKCCKGPQSRSPEYHRCKFLILQRIPLSKGIIFAKSAKKSYTIVVLDYGSESYWQNDSALYIYFIYVRKNFVDVIVYHCQLSYHYLQSAKFHRLRNFKVLVS